MDVLILISAAESVRRSIVCICMSDIPHIDRWRGGLIVSVRYFAEGQ
jgi:hypothetical protein